MAATGMGQQWVLVEMVQAFYEVRPGPRARGAARPPARGGRRRERGGGRVGGVLPPGRAASRRAGSGAPRGWRVSGRRCP